MYAPFGGVETETNRVYVRDSADIAAELITYIDWLRIANFDRNCSALSDGGVNEMFIGCSSDVCTNLIRL